MEIFCTKFRNNYDPSPYLTVEEQLITIRGHCPFKVIIPNKTGKNEMKVF